MPKIIPEGLFPIREVHIEVSIQFETGGFWGVTLADVHELAEFLKANPEIAKALKYVPKEKKA